MLIKNLEHLNILDSRIAVKGGETTTGDGSLPPEIKERILAKKNKLRGESISAVGDLSSFTDRFDDLGVRNRSSGGSSTRQRIRIPDGPDITGVVIDAEAPAP
ncbi:MAG: hypothetical protein ACFB14_08615 [Leptolyngbyaceae cyanobacterium]